MIRLGFIVCLPLLGGCSVFGFKDCLEPDEVPIARGSAIFYSEAAQYLYPFFRSNRCPALITGLVTATHADSSDALILAVETAPFEFQVRFTPSASGDSVELVSYKEHEGTVLKAELYEADLMVEEDEIEGEIALRIVSGSVYFSVGGVVRGQVWAVVEGGT
jgi:hypothetical protein